MRTPRALLGVGLTAAALLTYAAHLSRHATPTSGANRASTAGAPPPRLRPDAKILVTGGAGFVGYHLAQRLKRDGHSVLAFDLFTPYYSLALKRERAARLRDANIPVIEGDLCNETLLDRVLTEHGVTHVASLAAQAGVRYSLNNPQSYVRSNMQCFISLLESLRRRPHTVLVYASSSSVYGANKEAPFAEDDRVDSPNSLYAVTKRANEAAAHVYHGLYGLRVTGLRFFTVYGPWGRPDMAYFSFAHRMARGLPIEVYGRGAPMRDFTYVDDVVDGIVAALALGADEELFNLGNHRSVSLLHFIDVLEREVGVAANRSYVPMKPGDVPLTYADTTHAAERLGYEPSTTIEVGLKRFVQWYRSADFRAEFAESGEWLKR